jgi:6-phosphogluconolactonase
MPLLVAKATNPTWLEFSPDKKFLYTIHASEAQAIGFALSAPDSKNGIPTLTPLPFPPAPTSAAPSHLAIDATGRALLAANYNDGYVAALPIHSDGTLGRPSLTRHTGQPGPHPTRQTKAYPHSVTVSPDNRHVIVCDLGLDKIFTYALDPAATKLTPANPPFVASDPGAGPRHFKFGRDGRHAYAINELGNTISVYDYAAPTGTLTPRQTIPTLPPTFKDPNTTAEIRVHPNGKFVYGSNRGHDSIAVYAIDSATGLLTFVERTATGGKTPRNFALSPDGGWLVCGHQDTDIVTVFRVNPDSGRLTPTPHAAKVSMCVCVQFYD